MTEYTEHYPKVYMVSCHTRWCGWMGRRRKKQMRKACPLCHLRNVRLDQLDPFSGVPGTRTWEKSSNVLQANLYQSITRGVLWIPAPWKEDL